MLWAIGGEARGVTHPHHPLASHRYRPHHAKAPSDISTRWPAKVSRRSTRQNPRTLVYPRIYGEGECQILSSTRHTWKRSSRASCLQIIRSRKCTPHLDLLYPNPPKAGITLLTPSSSPTIIMARTDLVTLHPCLLSPATTASYLRNELCHDHHARRGNQVGPLIWSSRLRLALLLA
jgi:hypothetical protein